jgi:Mn-dependent DtxR family transcriptional regulator
MLRWFPVKAVLVKNSEAVDDYLKAIYSLSGDKQRCVGGSELAARLKIAPASVTNLLQSLLKKDRSWTTNAVKV